MMEKQCTDFKINLPFACLFHNQQILCAGENSSLHRKRPARFVVLLCSGILAVGPHCAQIPWITQLGTQGSHGIKRGLTHVGSSLAKAGKGKQKKEIPSRLDLYSLFLMGL